VGCRYTRAIFVSGSGKEFQDHDRAEVNDTQGRKGDDDGCDSVYWTS